MSLAGPLHALPSDQCATMQAMAGSRPGVWEYQLESLMEHAARMRGARSLSFPPVVAGGARANHIHYIRNDHQLK